MYYHVLIEKLEKVGKSETKRTIISKDKSEINEIIEDIVIPYQKGEEFIVNGFTLTKKDIVRLKITKSDKALSDLVKIANSKIPLSVLAIINEKDIIVSDKTEDITNQIYKQALGKVIEKTKQINTKITNRNEIFIVHGQDNEAKQSVARFVEKLGYKAVILHEQANKSMTIIEKIEENTNVGFAIVLYTPCDIGYKKDKPDEAKGRARQNVVFEHGYLISKIGRSNVCALLKENVEIPTDISGILYIKMDKSDSWKYELAKEMKNAGLDIDFNLILM